MTVPRRRICALRIRVSISPKGSFIDICPAPLPARPHESGDRALRRGFPERDTRHAELAVIGTRPARHLAAVAGPGGIGVARQLGQLYARLEALLHRPAHVV